MLPTTRKIRGPDGAEIAISESGSAAGPTLVLTHGWGADRNDWAYLVATLGSRFRIVSWDLPGLGESEPTRDLDYALPTLAKSLDRVVAASQERGPITLVGHSIGGMLNIEYARQYPAKLGPVVGRIVQVNTTFTNPVETKKGAERSRKLQQPVFEPMLGVIANISSLARGLGWLAYRSGLSHLQLASQSFAGSQSWAQLDHMASYAYRSSPGIVARGVLGMLDWDGTDALPRLHVPTLILTGVQDVTTLPAASERMQRDIPGSKLVAIERAAHLGPVERHDAYASVISDFVAAPPRAPAGN
jgi:pimeloyl-ACP methyl ester carboxylesterase